MLSKHALLLAALLAAMPYTGASSAEREDVRKVVNLVTAVKMPFPESLPRNRAKTERVTLERNGIATVGCILVDERRWCYEYISPIGNRLEMLRITNEPPGGAAIGSLHYYIVDFDLDGLIDVGSTTQIEALDRPRRIPIANVIRFYHRSTRRGETNLPDFQRMYDDGIQIALKYFGE
jgi:hypothetical protein